MGVPQNYVEAYVWLSLAAASGLGFAQASIDELAGWMTPEQISEAEKLAREWQPRGERAE